MMMMMMMIRMRIRMRMRMRMRIRVMVMVRVRIRLIDCEQSLVFLCKVVLHAKPKHVYLIITSWFRIALDEIRTRRI